MAAPTKADVTAALKTLSQAAWAEAQAVAAEAQTAAALATAKQARIDANTALLNLIAQLDPTTGASL
jgi:hypothetical protein